MADESTPTSERDEGVSQLINTLPTPPPRESFWSDLRAELTSQKPPSATSQKVRPDRSSLRSLLAAGAAALAVLAGVLLGIDRISGGGSGGQATCADIVIWNHSRYSGNSVHRKLRLAGRLPGTARVPSCEDIPGAEPGSAKAVVAYRIVGVSPSRAIALRDQPTTEFLFDKRLH